MHYTRVYYWVSSWWANRIGLASLSICYYLFILSFTNRSTIDRFFIIRNDRTRHDYSSLSLIPFWTLLSWWIFYTRYISRSSAIRPTLQTLGPIQSLLAFLCFFVLSLSLLVLISPVFGGFLYVRNNLIFAF